MTDWFLRLLGIESRNGGTDAEQSYSKKLLMGEAEPPSQYIRNKRLDKALQEYREAVKDPKAVS
jgi:hypothetical protein